MIVGKNTNASLRGVVLRDRQVRGADGDGEDGGHEVGVEGTGSGAGAGEECDGFDVFHVGSHRFGR